MVTFSEAQILAWLTPVLWPFLRALALLGSLPVFSQRSVPMRVKIALALFIALAAQASLPAMPVVPLDSPQAVMLVVQQLLIGLSLGFAVRVVFAAVELGGELIGLQMGLNFAGFFDPATASQGTASGRTRSPPGRGAAGQPAPPQGAGPRPAGGRARRSPDRQPGRPRQGLDRETDSRPAAIPPWPIRLKVAAAARRG